MKPYKGLIQIGCEKDTKDCPRKLAKDLDADCVNCPLAKVVVMGHEGEILATVTKPVTKTRTSKKAGR